MKGSGRDRAISDYYVQRAGREWVIFSINLKDFLIRFLRSSWEKLREDASNAEVGLTRMGGTWGARCLECDEPADQSDIHGATRPTLLI